MAIKYLTGDCRDILKTLPSESVHCVVTSPPYWGLRDYGTGQWEGGEAGCDHVEMKVGMSDKNTLGPNGYLPPTNAANVGRVRQYQKQCGKCGASRIDRQIGLEPDYRDYIATFREVRRVLRKDGTCWVNMGDNYANDGKWGGSTGGKHVETLHGNSGIGRQKVTTGLKPKDLCGIPWRVAFALQEDGWWLRQDIVWNKLNPMPESVRDRCCKSHEYVFLLSKSERYFFDLEAIKEDAGPEDVQYVPAEFAEDGVLQKQPTERRPNGKMPRVHGSCPETVGSQVQRLSEGASDSETLLLFGEGAEGQKGVQGILRSHGGNAGAVSACDAQAREGAKIQSPQTTIRPEPQGKSNKSPERQGVSTDGKGPFLEAQDRDQAQVSNQGRRLHADQGSMVRVESETSEPLCLLQSGVYATGNGSCHPVVEGGQPHDREHRPGVSDVQRQEGRPKRIKRSVWTIATSPYKDAHFATFPPALIEPMIRAGCPARCCHHCGAPWVRQIEISQANKQTTRGHQAWAAETGQRDNIGGLPQRTRTTTGFAPSCHCNAKAVPGVVLDPFAGSGTTGLVADDLQRHAILIDLSGKYMAMAKRRERPNLFREEFHDPEPRRPGAAARGHRAAVPPLARR